MVIPFMSITHANLVFVLMTYNILFCVIYSGPGRYASTAGSKHGTLVMAGATECRACEAGTFAKHSSQLVCLACEVGFTSAPGSSHCDKCLAGFYWNPTTLPNCVLGPEGVYLPSGSVLENLELKEGYFRFTSTANKVYECRRPLNCVGGQGRVTHHSLGSASSTETVGDFSSDNFCVEGAWGPLCDSCLPGYTHIFTDKCERCNLQEQVVGKNINKIHPTFL